MGTLTFHMVVMAFLNSADFIFEPKNSRTILAKHASGWRDRTEGRVTLAIFGIDMNVAAVFQR